MSRSISEILQTRGTFYRLKSPYSDIFVRMPSDSQFACGVTGKPGSGKSSWILQCSAYLCRYGKVLFGNIEEPTQGGTLKRKLIDMKIMPKRYPKLRQNFVFLGESENNPMDDLRERLNTGQYKFCVIDSVSKLVANKSAKLHQVLDIRKEYPKVNFIFILHYKKDGKGYKGASDLEHEFDYFFEIDKETREIRTIKNRFMGKKRAKRVHKVF